MYIPKYYREEDREEILTFLGKNNFGLLITYDEKKPVATHLPTEIVEGEKNTLTIYGHMAKANPQWKSFGDQEALFVFQGPHTYISPRWYNHVNVPTWNYMAVHIYGKIRVVGDEEFYEILDRLVKKHEAQSNYRMEHLPQDYILKQMNGTVGFALEATSIEAGFKLSQNRTDEDYSNIIRELESLGDEDATKVARAMRDQRDL